MNSRQRRIARRRKVREVNAAVERMMRRLQVIDRHGQFHALYGDERNFYQKFMDNWRVIGRMPHTRGRMPSTITGRLSSSAPNLQYADPAQDQAAARARGDVGSPGDPGLGLDYREYELRIISANIPPTE